MQNKKNEYEKFLQHIIGTTDLFSWISQWKILNEYDHTGKNKSIFNFSIIMSQRFTLGFPLNKKKYGANPFLAFQSREYSWAKSIIWRKAVVCLNENRIYLMTNKLLTIYNDYIPSFAISIAFQDENILPILMKSKKLSLKHLWYEDEVSGEELNIENYDNPIISGKASDIEIPIYFIENQSELFRDEDLDNSLSGDLDIIDKLMQKLSVENIDDIKYVGSNVKITLSEAEKKMLEFFLKPIDYEKPKIRISVD